MILMIDNYDSFTYNLVQYLEELGESVHVVTHDGITVASVADLDPEAIVISPGPSTPAEAGISVDVVRTYYNRYPILGVCLGHQSIGYAFGAEIVVNDRMMHGKISTIHHDNASIYTGLSQPFDATRYHSLVIDEDTLPGCLEVSARSENGEIMGVRHREYPVEGVQFHPESIMTPEGKKLLANFLTIARRWRGPQKN
ncbi:MAG: anthranilate synthase component II [Solirubrobacterales bacterium]